VRSSEFTRAEEADSALDSPEEEGLAPSQGQARGNRRQVIADGITLERAKDLFPAYKIVGGGRKRDPLDYRLPGSYGSRQ
jgi:hypothetical protein